MAEFVAEKLVEEVSGSLLSKVKKEIDYMWNSKEHVEKLRNEVDKLKNRKARVELKIKSANDKGYCLLPGVENWVDQADAHITKAEEILKEEADAKKTCFNFWMCVNPNTLHHYGKQAVIEVPFLEQHQRDGASFEGEISIPTSPPKILDLYQRKTIDELETHKSVLENIIHSIEDVSTQIIGIYGTGGVGKTTLAKEVAAKMKDRELLSHIVIVTVSQRADATKIQEEVKVAARRIMKGEKVLIILDDVWREIKLDEVGIPCGTDHPNCKILLTSRKRSVCRAMNALEICVDPLPIKEAWILFKRVVGERVETDTKLKQVAMKVAEGCGGLPLIIQAVGNALKSESIREWETALVKLKNHETSDIDPEISFAFTHLQLSYDHLDNEEVRTCFLLCSMFPEDYSIQLESLVYYCVGLQVFKDLTSLEAARNKVQGAVRILKSSCLLLDGEDENRTKMHDVVREVALLIASKDDYNFLVEAGKNLTEWEPRIGSLERYTGISLMSNDICKLPAGYELNVPLLKIFLMQSNHGLSEISDEFIRAMKGVEVIDFEYCRITSLPKSLNQLTRLHMLNLGFTSLRDVSMLGELTQLEILILSYTHITEIPQEIGKLVNLRVFHAKYCQLSHIAPGVLSKLRWLEELHISSYQSLAVMGDHMSLMEIDGLSKLTCLKLFVHDICLLPIGDYLKRLNSFCIEIGKQGADLFCIPESSNKILYIETPNLGVSKLMDVRILIEVCDCICLQLIENLDNIMPMMCCEDFGLKNILIGGCDNLLCLVDSRVLRQFEGSDHEGVIENTRFFSEVENLYLEELSSLKVIWNCPDQYISLNNLVKLQITHCPKLEKLFTVSVAQSLVNLRNLYIVECESLKEVISYRNEETSNDEIDTVVPATNIVFPRLARIYLDNLKNLTSFYPGYATIKYPSLVVLVIVDCDKMEKWGYGTHDMPNLVVTISERRPNGSTIDETLAKYGEDVLQEENCPALNY